MITRYFRLQELQTRQEIIDGGTTFITMAYIIIVNPKILEAAGIQFGSSMVATAAGIEAGEIRSSLVVKLVSCL